MFKESIRPLVLGFEVLQELPRVLQPLANEVVSSYQQNHPDLRSIFIIGSVAIGEWIEEVSDLDVVGVMDHAFTLEDEAERRQELLILGDTYPQVSFVNNSALSLDALNAEDPDLMIVGRARIIAVCGMHLWGDKLNFQKYIPTVETMARERTARAKRLMARYRSGGVINEPFRSDPALLARSCAKAAIRALSGITILRGAAFYASSQMTVEMVQRHAPEAASIGARALDIVDGIVEVTPNVAMEITEEAIELFYELYPHFLQT